MIKDHKKEWSKGFTKGKVIIMVSMLNSDALTNSGIFEEVTMDETAWENNKIVMIVDASLIISVDGLVTSGMF